MKIKNKGQSGQALEFTVISLSLIILVWVLLGIRTTQPGYIRLVTSGGRLTGRVMNPGWGWVAPVINGTVKFDTRWQVYETSEHPLESKANYADYLIGRVRSSDGQLLELATSTKFRVSASCATKVLTEYGTLNDAVEKVVKYSIRTNARSVAAGYVVEDFNTYDRLREYEKEVQNILNKEGASACVEFFEFALRGPVYDPDYAAAIERQQIAEEDIQTAEFRAREAEQVAQAAIETAKGEAESTRINAEGEALAIKTLANAKAEAIEVTGRALDKYPSALQWEFIQKLSKVSWGVVPMDSNLLLTPGVMP